jgi:outer membrane lipoprotein-sorting protein
MKMFLIFFLLFFCSSSFSLTAKEIVARSDQLIRGNSSVGEMSMTVNTPSWKRTLEFRSWSKGKDKMLIRITYPKKEAGLASLKIGSNMWNYLPKINRTIKIPPSMMLQSWMGSDFTNDDLVKESSMVDDYSHTLLGTVEVGVIEIIGTEEVAKKLFITAG